MTDLDAAEPCIPWTMDTGCCGEWETYEPEIQERAEALAWNTIRTLTAGQVGSCPVLVRPCLSAPCDVCAGWWMNPTIIGGKWYNVACGTPHCSCARVCEIVMPGAVAAVVEVNLDGVAMDLAAFRVDNGNRIVRMDGQCWPSCQNMNAPAGDVGTLSIVYVPGIQPDASGLWAAGVLACEFAKACSGAKCRLPSSVTSISRQGVNFTMMTSMFEGGMTGIREVDAWLYSINPHGLRTPSTVWSPDLPQHRFQTWRPA